MEEGVNSETVKVIISDTEGPVSIGVLVLVRV